MLATPQLICYSKNGHSRKLAQDLAKLMAGALQEVEAHLYQWPILGSARAGHDGFRGVAAPLKQVPDLTDADAPVVLVGPVWAGKPASPLNSVIDLLQGRDNPVAIALTCANPKEQQGALTYAQARLGRSLIAELMMSNAAQRSAETAARELAFVDRCEGDGPK